MIGRRSSNGRTPLDSDAEIARLKADIAQAERSGPPLAERLADALAALEQCENYFRQAGFTVTGLSPDADASNFRASTIGALMVAARDVIVANEEARVRSLFEADPRLALSIADRDARLTALRLALRKALAARELAWRERETKGESIDRTDADAEMFLRIDRDLVSISQGEEVAA
jgi:hypothetical protein